MNIILLSGGSGKRLWPLSNEVRSKQFLKIFRKGNTKIAENNGEESSRSKESMVQRMYRMIREIAPDSVITIATSKDQIPQIQSQLGENINISIEPCRKDTFPAIALASAFLHDKLGVGKDEPVVVCPVDPYVEKDYFECLKRLSDEATKNETRLVLMGIQPTYPATKYGYIIPAEADTPVSSVLSFKEKPDEKTAEAYIAQGALWNGGVFAFKLNYILSIASSLLGSSDYDSLYSNYENLNRISFDYAVAEKEKHIRVIRFNGSWKDLGTWNTLTEAMDEPTTGNAIAQDCTSTHVINELGLPLVALGMKDCVIAATPDGILVSDKEKSTQLKDVLNKDVVFSDNRPMYERRTWGEYKILDYKLHKDNQNSLVKELIISAGQHISYQKHSHRTEIWTFTEGTGELILDGKTTQVGVGDVAVIKPGMNHAIKGLTELHIIEVQLGDELTEDDIERLDWDWRKHKKKLLLITFSDNADHQDITFGMFESLYNAQNSDYEVYVMAINTPKVSLMETQNSYLVNCPKRPGIQKKTFDIFTLKSIIHWINQQHFDVCFFETLHAWNLPIMMCCHKSMHIFQMIHDIIPHDNDKQAVSVKAMNRIVCKMADYIVLANRKYLSKISELYGIDNNHVLSVDMWRRFPKYTEPRFTKRVLFFGRINPYKGIENLVKIVNLCPDIKFDIVGRVDSQMRELVEQLRNFSNVTMSNNYVTDKEMAESFINADWIILPYQSATQSGVVIDSYRYSRPCIAFNVGAISEQIKDGTSGYLIKAGDISAFANRLRKAISMDREEYEQMCKNAYQYGYKKYDANGAVERFIKLIET